MKAKRIRKIMYRAKFVPIHVFLSRMNKKYPQLFVDFNLNPTSK